MSMNSGSIPQNKALISSDQLAKFAFFGTEMLADDSGTFFRNEGHHLEKKV